MGRSLPVVSRRLGIISGFATAALGLAYLATLALGLQALPSPEAQIGEPFFPILEVLILLMMPAILTLLTAVVDYAPAGRRILAQLALVFMSILAALTSTLHFTILVLTRHPEASAMPGLQRLLAFEWPSLAYAIDILAWDVFFPLAALSAAAVFGGSRLEQFIRWLLIVSGVLALAGLGGVVTGEMDIRNIGIAGYAIVFPVAAALTGLLLLRTPASG